MSEISDFECETVETIKNSFTENDTKVVDAFLRKYRLAISTTAEYSQFWLDGTETSDAERKGKVLAALNTSMIRINGIFERDFGVTMELIANNDQVVYLNPATDPYNGVSNSILQNTLDNVIGNSNYDVGHLVHFSGSRSGNAGCIACVCTTGSKGSGWTQHPTPASDDFNMIVSHEFGHQFGGWHVQSSSNCRSANGLQEVEPGSGSSIMGYAGICPANVQNFADDYFNYVDIRDVIQWTRFDSSCAQLIPTGNTDPTANAGNDYTIPKSTAFKLEGVGTDVDAGDNLSYCWEENDPENPNSNQAPSPTRTQGPMFRSKLPVGTPIRYIPQLSDVIAGNLTPTWEVLPSVSRTMDIRFTVRDNAIFGPQTASDEMTVTVNASAGPFQVTSQSSSETWDVGTNVTINWDVANTNQSPINTNSVTILLSVDGGFTYPHTLVANTTNDGSETFLLPNVPTSNQGRIMVKPINNIYFAINSSNINIQASEFIMNFIETDIEVCQPNNAIYNFTYNTFLGFSETTTFEAANLPSGSSVSFNPISATTDGTDVQVTVSNTQNVAVGSYDFDIVGTAPSVSRTSTVSLHIFDSNLVTPTLQFPTNGQTSINPNVNLTWNTDLNASSYAIEIAQDAGFTTIIETGNSITNQYQATSLDFDTEYFWRVKMNNECGSSNFSSVFSFVTFCIAPTNVNVSNVLIDNALVNWTENGNATSWEIEIVETGNSPTGVGVSAPTNPFTITSLNSSTDYNVYVRSSCGSGNFSDWTLSSIFTTGADFCNGDNFYDSGGAGGNYSDGESIITTIAPSTGFNVVTVQFNSFNTEGCCDFLKIYDGPDTTATLLGTFGGSTNPGTFTSTHGTGALTFWFTSDGSVTSSGWDANVICSSISCPNPFNFEANNILGDSVDLNWMAGDTETNWQIEYGLNGFTQGNGTIVPITTNSHSLTGLNAATNYDVYLRANCGTNPGDDDSAWLGPLTFMTLCDVVNAPWLDNVEAHQGTESSDIQNCWSSTPNNTVNAYRWDVSEFGNTPSSGTGPNSGNSGSKYFYTESSGYNTGDVAELYTPLLDLSTMSIPQLSFYYHMFGGNMGSLHVDIFNNGTWFDDEIVITGAQHTSGSDAWTEQLLLLTAYTGEIQIRFRGIRGTGYESDMSIDDIQIFEAPTCPDPTDFITLNATFDSVDLSWTIGNTETNWEIEYGLNGFAQGTGTTVQVTTNPYTLTGLNFDTNYAIYLRANCGANSGDDDSNWLGPISFSTLGISTPNNLTGEVNQETGEVSLNWQEGSGATAINEDFDDGVADNWIPVTGNWNVSGGNYNVFNPSNPTFGTSSNYYEENFSNFELEIKVRKTFGHVNDTGLYINGNPEILTSMGHWANTYRLSCSATGSYVFGKRENGNWTTIHGETSPDANLDIGSWNVLKVVYANGFIDLFLNGILQGTYFDDTFTSGKIGINMFNGTAAQSSTGEFDYVILTPLSKNYTFGTVNQSEYRNVYANNNCINNNSCQDEDIIDTILAPIPPVQNYTYTKNGTRDFINYNVYRDNVIIGTATDTNYLDNLTSYGTYDYYVTTLFDEGESEPSNTIIVVYEGNPDISVNPTSLTETLPEGGTSTQILTITNSGVSDLDFEISTTEVSGLNNEDGTWTIIEDNTEYIFENTIPPSTFIPGYSKKIFEIGNGNLNILVMENGVSNPYYENALTNLGLSFTSVSSWNLLNNELLNGTEWDLVIANSYGNSVDTIVLDNLNIYQLNGGLLIYSHWGVNSYTSHPLLSNFGVNYVSSILNPINFSATNSSHRMFNNPNQISNFNWTDDQGNRDGQIVNVISGATQLASFDGFPTSGAIVLNAQGNCIFNAFQSSNFQADDNTNSKLDIVELIENQITFLTGSAFWLTAAPISGTVPAGTSVDINVHFDATNLLAGVYNANLDVTSNDPDEPIVTVPVQLTVTPPTCPNPTIFESSNLTSNSVDLSWINGNTESAWEIEYGLTGFTQGNGTILQVTTNPYSLTSLNSDTNYDVYLRANCGINPGDDDSSWVGPISFMTLISCPEPSNLVALNNTSTTIDLSWINGNTESAWEIEYGLNGFTQGNGAIIQVTTNPYTITGLNSGTNYNIYLRANCGANPGDDDSSWLGPISFMTLISCPEPSNLVAINNTDTTIDLSWTNGNTESAWELEYGLTGFTQGNGTILQVTTNPYTLTGLNLATNYDVYLRANCGVNSGDDDSSWIGPVNVNTNCNFNTPWFDNIENYSVGTLHQCQWTSWDGFSGGGDDFKVTDNITFSGTKSLYIPNDNVTDGVIDLGNKTSGHWTLKFKMYIPSNSTGYFNLQGQVPINGGEWIVGNIHFNEANSNSGTGHIDNSFNGDIFFNFPHDQWFNIEMNFDLTSGISSATWEFKVDGNIVINEFTPFTDNNGMIPTSLGGVNFFSIDNDNFVYLDDFEYREYNISCPSPSNFNTTNVTTTSVDLNWINGGTETNWQLEYGLDGFSQGNGTIVSTAINSYNLTGLNSDTNYDVYLRANCGANPGDDDSSWVGPISFATLVSCPSPSNMTAFNITANAVDLSWTNGSSESSWQIEYGLSGFSQGNGIVVQTNSNPYNLNTLNIATQYDVYLRANCGANPGDDDSSWSGPFSFMTLCSEFGVPFSEDFDNFNTPDCWTEFGSESWNFNTNPDYQAASAGDHTDGGGTNFAWIDGSDPSGSGQISKLRTPVLDVSSLTQPSVQYAVYSYNTDDNTYNTLEVSIHNIDGVSFTFQTLQESTNGWQVFTFDLSSLITGNLFQIEFSIAENSPGNSFYNDILIDDVKVDEYNNLTVSQDDFALFNFNYYPNPVTDELILSANEQISSINVYTILGQEIIKLRPNNSSLVNVDMSLLSSGTYFVKVQIDSKNKVLKIIKK